MEAGLRLSLHLGSSLRKQLQRCVARPAIGFGQNEKPCDQTMARLNRSFNTSTFFRAFKSNCILHFWGSIEMKGMFFWRQRMVEGNVCVRACKRESAQKNITYFLFMFEKIFSMWKHSRTQNPEVGFIIRRVFLFLFQMQTTSGRFVVEEGKENPLSLSKFILI